uniref:Putative disease resistance protein RGA1 n=1 Tax=Aegilops tauschii TaxID=37682 RepID=R7W465_AEGTA
MAATCKSNDKVFAISTISSKDILSIHVVLNVNDESLVEGLKDIGMEIIERCDGLPLAVKVVGGLLLSKGKTRGDWLDVCSNVAWSMTTISDDVNQAVYVSYEELPHVLKQCLLYCSLFPKDVLIKSADIVNMWIAEGFIHITSMKQPEDLGAEYYKQLVSRNLLDPDYRFYDQKACTMHDVIRSFSQSVVKHEGLFVEEGLNPSFTSGTSISEIPQGIGDLMFMQFIELADCVKISHVPDSILKLRKLRYINFAGTNIASIPRGFGKLEDLVMISGFPTHSDDNTDQVWSSLEELGPLSRLTMLAIESLEKASSGSVAARAKLSSKAHLRILNLGFTIRLAQNREVEEQNNGEQERIEEVLGNLCPPTCIEQLAIIGYFGHKLPQWMRMVSVFTFLKRLELSSYACYELPSGLGQLPSLDYFWVDQAPFIQYIGHGLHMPSIGGRGIGLDKMLSGGGVVVAFPKLRKLGFQGMFGLTEWEWEQQVPAMTTLEVLTIVNCQLKYLPPGLAHHANALRELDLRNLSHLLSIHNFPSLVELRIVDNRTLERINNNPNLQHIYIVSCPGLKVLEDLPSLKSIEWVDVTAQVLPDYFRHSKLDKLIVQCYISLLKLISLQDANSSGSEWGKIQHVQQLRATGYISAEETRYISYTKEPYSYKTDIVAGGCVHVEAWRVIFLQAIADTTRKGLCMVCSPYNRVDDARL